MQSYENSISNISPRTKPTGEQRPKYYVVFFIVQGHLKANVFIKKNVFSHRLHIPSIERNPYGILDILISVHFEAFWPSVLILVNVLLILCLYCITLFTFIISLMFSLWLLNIFLMVYSLLL